jgi:putative PIG3 family NAD(P)H quinone oxidoreductase
MQAVVVSQFGDPSVLRVKSVDTPYAQAHEVLVKIKATAVNRADILQRQGHYPPPPHVPKDILGLEFAGTVEAIGTYVSNFKVGDKVFGIAGGGTYAEYLVINEKTLALMPSNLTYTEAASIPEAFITAYDAMVEQGNLSCGETVLISAVGSGVGVAAVQIAKAIGAISIGTARNENKLVQAKNLGMNHGLLVKDDKFADQIIDITKGAGIDLVLELVGGNYVSENIKCLAIKGRMIIVGLVGGAKAQLNLADILSKRINIKGTTLRRRPLEEKIAATKLLSKHLVPLFEQNLLKPVIDKIFSLEEASSAHTYVEQNENFGKVVLTGFN